MAQEDGSSWWDSWTTGLLENVREKTSTALEFVQSDLSEFVSTIQHDTSVVIADSATAVNRNIKVEATEKDAASGKLKQGFSNILTSITTSLQQSADRTSQPTYSQNENLTDESNSTRSVMPVYDRTQARMQEMQTDPETYRNDPDSDAYQAWCKTFDLDSKKGEISELLVNNPDVRRLYTKFVPSIQSHSTFWHRYFYKVHEIETENKRLADIVARASRNDSHDLGWDDEDDEDYFTTTVTSKGENVCTTVDSNVTADSEPRDEIPLNEDSKSLSNQQDGSLSTSASQEINTKDNLINTDTNVGFCNCKPDETQENIGDHKHNQSSCSLLDEASSSNGREMATKDNAGSSGVETKSEGEKSDSSDSSSWIRVLDKEGSSSHSSSSIVVVNEKDKELDSDEQVNDDVDDDDDDLDISDEDVEKLVQSITANELDSGEDDWEDWE